MFAQSSLCNTVSQNLDPNPETGIIYALTQCSLEGLVHARLTTLQRIASVLVHVALVSRVTGLTSWDSKVVSIPGKRQ